MHNNLGIYQSVGVLMVRHQWFNMYTFLENFTIILNALGLQQSQQYAANDKIISWNLLLQIIINVYVCLR